MGIFPELASGDLKRIIEEQNKEMAVASIVRKWNDDRYDWDRLPAKERSEVHREAFAAAYGAAYFSRLDSDESFGLAILAANEAFEAKCVWRGVPRRRNRKGA